jgi:uncharacterized membrane protein
MTSPESARTAAMRAFHPFDLRQARARLFLSVIVGVAASSALALVPSCPGLVPRIIAGWDAGSAVLLGLAWSIIWRADTAKTRLRAAAEDPGRSAVWGIVLVASTLSLFAAIVLLRGAKSLAATEGAVFVGLCLGAVGSAWMLTHTAYTLRYAHLYYRDDDDGEGGLTFPGDQAPMYFDFAYFSFTVGMCFQVSDVCITSPAIRRAVLGHSLLSFAYNTAILALSLNLVFALLG